jgi:hypothetical protein
MLMLPVDFENGDSSMGVEALSLVIDEGESKENDCERMRTFGLGVRGGAAKRAAMVTASVAAHRKLQVQVYVPVKRGHSWKEDTVKR